MLVPVLSVTAIGLAVALAATVFGRPPVSAVVRAVSGAWLGFLAGALPGVVLDALLHSGRYLAIIGHACAAGGAALAVVFARRSVSGER